MFSPRIGVRTMLGRPQVNPKFGGTHHTDGISTCDTDTPCGAILSRLWIQGGAGSSGFGRAGASRFEGDFSDFFNSIFSGADGEPRRQRSGMRGQDAELEMPIFLEETVRHFPDKKLLRSAYEFQFDHPNPVMRAGRFLDRKLRLKNRKYFSKYNVARRLRDIIDAV